MEPMKTRNTFTFSVQLSENYAYVKNILEITLNFCLLKVLHNNSLII